MWLVLAFISVANAEDPTQECVELSDRMEQILARVQELQVVTAPESESIGYQVSGQPEEDIPSSPAQPPTQPPAPPTDTSDETLDAVAESPT